MFKKILYETIVEKLNLNTQGLLFDDGYDMVIYQGIPFVIQQDSLNKFNYEKKEVIPVAEEYNQETPFFDPVDRSDYVCQYQILFRLEMLSKIETALEEFRAYMLANKQHEIDGYNVSFKVTRGQKQPTWTPDGGNYYGRYKIDVYVTSTLGYLCKDTDIWEIKEYNESTYQTLNTVDDIGAQNNNAQPDNTGDTMGHYNTTGTLSQKFIFPYDGSDLAKTIYQQTRNKGNKKLFNLRETFDGVVNEYVVYISSGARTKKINEPVFVEFDVVEQ